MIAMETLPRVIGTGSGRCGTMSLAVLLSSQVGYHATHERFKYKIKYRGSGYFVRRFYGGTGADVALQWLWYTDLILSPATHPDAKAARIICLRRDRQATIDSYMAKTRGKNHFQPLRIRKSLWRLDAWDDAYPDYEAETKREAVAKYYDDYYRQAERYEKKYPGRFKIFATESLNSERGVKCLLTFAGIPVPRQVVMVGVRQNQTPSSVIRRMAEHHRIRSTRRLR